MPRIPASFFGIVLGLSGLASLWRAAHDVWGFAGWPGEALAFATTVVWVALVALFAAKWLLAREDALREVEHPVASWFLGLPGVGAMLVASDVLPYSRALATVLFAAGAAYSLGFVLWRAGALWRGGRDASTTTPAMYLPSVAPAFVAAGSAAALGYPDWGRLLFGIGFFSWLAVESVLLHRLAAAAELPSSLRPALAIQLAPPAVGAAALLATGPGPFDVLVEAMLGYAMLQLLLLLRLLPWIAAERFGPSYWAFSFGLTALATAAMRFPADASHMALPTLAPALFLVANLGVGTLVVGTAWLLVSGRLLPRPTPA